jgi:hypothetical protein
VHDDIGDATSSRRRWLGWLAVSSVIAAAVCVGATRTGTAAAGQPAEAGSLTPTPTVTWATAHDVSPPLRDLAASRVAPDAEDPAEEPDLGPISAADNRHSSDGALQTTTSRW